MTRPLHTVESTPTAPPELAALAQAARDCPAMELAHRLADWVAQGRDLTPKGVLKPAAVPEVCELLGIEITGKPRSALDVAELMAVWDFARDAEFISVVGRRVHTGPGLREWSSGKPEGVLRIWLQATLKRTGLSGDPDAELSRECLTVLHTLYERDDAASLADLVAANREPTDVSANDGEPCPDCGQVHEAAPVLSFLDLDPDADDDEELIEAAVLVLRSFGVLTPDDSTVGLSSLGAMLTTIMFRDSAPPASADAKALVTTLTPLPPAVAMTMAQPWLEGRTPADGVRELLTFAESATGQARLSALTLAEEAGPDGAQAWREWAAKPGFGAYARQWLAEQGEPVEPHTTDEAWLTVDMLATMLDSLPAELPPLLLTAVLQAEIGSAAAEVLPLLGDSGHPAAADLVRMLGGSPATPLPGPAAARGGKKGRGAKNNKGSAADVAYQLKITLRGVSKPPVWRRVLVPAGIRLDELHEVIQCAMGWDDGHMHSFSLGMLHYGISDPELGHEDERSVPLSQLLTEPGDKLLYTYDFGDGWEHDILLEQTSPIEPGERYPRCVTGKGACPPEDCGGVWGYANLKEALADPGHEEHEDLLEWLSLDTADDFDPTAFSADEINMGLARLGN
jgi:hypothetical protein